jgi:hypothetical protein
LDELDKLIRRKDIINHIKTKKIKLVWPFTANAGGENGKEKYISGNRC